MRDFAIRMAAFIAKKGKPLTVNYKIGFFTVIASLVRVRNSPMDDLDS